MLEKRFSIRLANGAEKTFGSAAALADWTASQREVARVTRSLERRRTRRGNRTVRQSKRRCHASGANDGDALALPLARYNRKDADQ